MPTYMGFTIFSIIFGMLNVTLLIPLLNVIFSKQEIKNISLPDFSLSVEYFTTLFNFWMSKIHQQFGALGSLYFICAVVLSSVTMSNLLRYFAQRTMIKIRVGIITELRKIVFEKITQLDLSFFGNKRKGDLISVMSNDLQSVEDSVVASLTVLFRDPLMIIFYFIILFYLSVKLTLFTLLILPITGFLIAQISKRLKQDATNSQSILGNILSIAEETISGIRIIKAFNAQKYVKDKFIEQNDAYAKRFKSMTYKREVASPLTEFIAYAVIVSIIVYVGPMLLNNEAGMTAAQFISYIVFYVNILVPAKNISNSIANLQRGFASADRIFEILEVSPEINENKNAEHIVEFKDKIEIKNLGFAYTQGDNGWVLKNINLTIERGKMIALVGHSGSGKTTLSDMFPRYYDPNEGDIFLDGISIKKYFLSDLRKLMGVVSQESILFNDTIHNNIAFGNPSATNIEVMNAAKIANAHDFIMQTEDGYRTKIGDRGSKLSGGQRQRISIARAVLKNPPIMILDEATSALDAENERAVQEALYNLMKNRTSIVIAHRLSTVQNADCIVVLDRGKIVQTGTHEELIKAEGVYKQLNDLQKLE